MRRKKKGDKDGYNVFAEGWGDLDVIHLFSLLLIFMFPYVHHSKSKPKAMMMKTTHVGTEEDSQSRGI